LEIVAKERAHLVRQRTGVEALELAACADVVPARYCTLVYIAGAIAASATGECGGFLSLMRATLTTA
tara:strand:+ start:291 stop:491 length:201 start_codon:yes stop_codon:yes gene_type:complete